MVVALNKKRLFAVYLLFAALCLFLSGDLLFAALADLSAVTLVQDGGELLAVTTGQLFQLLAYFFAAALYLLFALRILFYLPRPIYRV